MKRVEAYIRVNKLESVKFALEKVGICGLTCEQVRGYGRQFGRTDVYRGSSYALNLIPKMRLDIVVPDDQVELAIETIINEARSGEIGDGKIFVYDVLDAIRIRTSERGDAAIQ